MLPKQLQITTKNIYIDRSVKQAIIHFFADIAIKPDVKIGQQ